MLYTPLVLAIYAFIVRISSEKMVRSPIEFYSRPLTSNLPYLIETSDIHGCCNDHQDNGYQHQKTLKYVSNEDCLDTAYRRIKRAD